VFTEDRLKPLPQGFVVCHIANLPAVDRSLQPLALELATAVNAVTSRFSTLLGDDLTHAAHGGPRSLRRAALCAVESAPSSPLGHSGAECCSGRHRAGSRTHAANTAAQVACDWQSERMLTASSSR
jgi:hypothetical protein